MAETIRIGLLDGAGGTLPGHLAQPAAGVGQAHAVGRGFAPPAEPALVGPSW